MNKMSVPHKNASNDHLKCPPLASRTDTSLWSTLFVKAEISSGNMEAAQRLIDLQSDFKLLYCWFSAYTFLFRMAQKCSIGFRSGLFGGYTISLSPTKPALLSHSVVYFAACPGALSCIKIISDFSCPGSDWNHGRLLSCKRLQYTTLFTFTPSGIMKGPTKEDPTMPAQIIIPPPPCCLLIIVSGCLPGKIHPLDHPSGPSKVTRLSSVQITFEKSCFKYCLAHFNLFSLWILVKTGLFCFVLTVAKDFRILQRVVFGTFGSPAFSKISLLVRYDFLLTMRWIFRISLGETDRKWPLFSSSLHPGGLKWIFWLFSHLDQGQLQFCSQAFL